MIPTTVIALFCDDIREEKSGALTLIGVMGDNVSIPPLPEVEGGALSAIIPRIAIYIRINFDVTAVLDGPISFKIIMPDGTIIDAGGISESTIAEARGTSEKGNPVAGIISRLVFGGIAIKNVGRMLVEVTIGDQKYLAGFLNFVTSEPSATS